MTQDREFAVSVRQSIAQVVPGVAALDSYRPSWLRKDLAAGLILTALLVPQGMAYAELAGLPPITGLYTSILCLLGYAVFGPSKVLVLGPDSALGPMIAACVIPLVAANGDPGKAVAYASILALMVGAITVLAGVFKLGFVADLLSKPTQIGYMNGLALTIVIGQLPKLFGFSVDGDGLIEETTAVRQRRRRRQDGAGRAGGRARFADPDPGLPAVAAEGARGAGRRRAGDRGGERVRPDRPRGQGRRPAAGGVPAVHHPDRAARRPDCCCSPARSASRWSR